MSRFSDSPKWKLVNRFTIHEDRRMHDRAFMLTCVPKQLDIEVSSFEIIRNIQWPFTSGDDKRPEHYVDQSYLRFSGRFRDRIVVFTMGDGEVATFGELTDATIRPLPSGYVGGANKGTVIDGYELSVMPSHDVPDEGLLVGEPGSLWFSTEWKEAERPMDGTTRSHLSVTLYLDEDKFFSFLADLSDRSRQVTRFKVRLIVELFESEVDASLSEQWMKHDYGLLMQNQTSAYTRARLEGIEFSTGITKLVDREVSEEVNRSIYNRFATDETRDPPPLPSDPSRAFVKYIRYVLVALIILIASNFLR